MRTLFGSNMKLTRLTLNNVLYSVSRNLSKACGHISESFLFVCMFVCIID